MTWLELRSPHQGARIDLPVCGDLLTRKGRARRPRLPRMSRAQWLAFGSTLTVAGCGGNTGISSEAEVLVKTGDASASRSDGETFPCDYDAFGCVRATEYCRSGVTQCGPAGCISIPPACLATPTCACIVGAADYGVGSCDGDDAGALAITCPCYGSPPARLERLKAAPRILIFAERAPYCGATMPRIVSSSASAQ